MYWTLRFAPLDVPRNLETRVKGSVRQRSMRWLRMVAQDGKNFRLTFPTASTARHATLWTLIRSLTGLPPKAGVDRTTRECDQILRILRLLVTSRVESR